MEYSIETRPDYQTQIWFPMTEEMSEKRLGTNLINELIGDIMETHNVDSELIAYTDMFKMIKSAKHVLPVLKITITCSRKTNANNVVATIDEMTKKVAERLMHSFNRESIRVEYPERTSYFIKKS